MQVTLHIVEQDMLDEDDGIVAADGGQDQALMLQERHAAGP